MGETSHSGFCNASQLPYMVFHRFSEDENNRFRQSILASALILDMLFVRVLIHISMAIRFVSKKWIVSFL